MRIIEGCSKFYIDRSTAVSIGKFDGIHRGHQLLLEEILRKREQGLAACVFTFDPPPEVFFGHREEKQLTTRQEKRMLLQQMGVDILVEFPLYAETAAMEPENFVREVLCESMHAGFIAAGTDLSFGRRGMGNCALLQSMKQECGFEVRILDKLCQNGREISSTYVREAVEAGNMELAEQLLGQPYPVFGEIVQGNRIGRTIGFPTINQVPPESKLLPPFGVYYSEVEICGNRYKGITNIGKKPTVNKGEGVGVETFLYNFNQNVYQDMALVRLLSFRRPEQKFPDLNALRNQLKQDIEAGYHYCHTVE